MEGKMPAFSEDEIQQVRDLWDVSEQKAIEWLTLDWMFEQEAE
jgi:hypothetical protein